LHILEAEATDALSGERASMVRRFHHRRSGFASFASTTTAAIYHNVLGWKAPYELTSLPVVLGTIGGFVLLVGPLGLLALKSVRDPAPADPLQSRMDVAFLVLLFSTSLTGLLLLLLRETAAMGVILAVSRRGPGLFSRCRTASSCTESIDSERSSDSRRRSESRRGESPRPLRASFAFSGCRGLGAFETR
jgi:hypothetical protein